MVLDDHAKWEAVLRRDNEVGHHFFYGVGTTKVYCLPSCRSKVPLRKNVEFFDSPREAEQKGYRPCKRCKPNIPVDDRTDFQIDLVKDIYDRFFDDRKSLTSELEKIGIRKNSLVRRFEKKFHTTPTRYLNGLRTEKAARLLSDPSRSIMKIAYECGFGSVPGLYGSFRSRYGMTPQEFRKGGTGHDRKDTDLGQP